MRGVPEKGWGSGVGRGNEQKLNGLTNFHSAQDPFILGYCFPSILEMRQPVPKWQRYGWGDKDQNAALNMQVKMAACLKLMEDRLAG